MTAKKYEHLIVSELRGPEHVMAKLAEYNKIGKRILWVDSSVVPGSFQMNCSWYMHSSAVGPMKHVHDVDEVLGFYSSDPDNPYDLGAEVEIWLGDERFVIDRSVLIYIPAGVPHCPLKLLRVDRPIIHFSEVTSSEYTSKEEGWVSPPPGGYANHIVTELKAPPEKLLIADDYNKYATRILWLDENVVPGALHINTSWFRKASPTLENVPHVHQDDDEIIGFIGSDPDNPADLNGEVEIWIGDEQYIFDRSTMIFVPAGLKHCPLILRRVDRPIFHFTTVPGKRYLKDDVK